MKTGTSGAGGWGEGDQKKAISKSVKAGLQSTVPVGRIATYLKKVRYAERFGGGAPVYVAAVLEYLAADIYQPVPVLELGGNAARDDKKSRINPKHPCLAIRKDDELGKQLQGATIASGGVVPNVIPILHPKKTAASETDKKSSAPKSPKKA